MVWMFVAEVIVPFTIDHAYVVAPAGPLAVLPVEFAQTCAGVGVIVGVGGFGLTVTVMVLLVTGLTVVQASLLVIVTSTSSPSLRVEVEKVGLSVPALLPLTVHWKDGAMPPFTGDAVKITFVPSQKFVSVAAMLTDGVTHSSPRLASKRK